MVSLVPWSTQVMGVGYVQRESLLLVVGAGCLVGRFRFQCDFDVGGTLVQLACSIFSPESRSSHRKGDLLTGKESSCW